MRKIVYGMAVSLDGFMEGPNGEHDWISGQPANPEKYMEPFDTFLIGRKSYEKMLSMGGSYSFPGIKNVVVSRSLKKVAKEFELTGTDTIEEVRKMKELPGKDIALYGGAELASSLIRAGLVDEVVLSLESILIGAGSQMFQNLGERTWLKLIEATPYSSGIVLHYAVERKKVIKKPK